MEKLKHNLKKIAVITGATVITSKKGLKLSQFKADWFGSCNVLMLF